MCCGYCEVLLVVAWCSSWAEILDHFLFLECIVLESKVGSHQRNAVLIQQPIYSWFECSDSCYDSEKILYHSDK